MRERITLQFIPAAHQYKRRLTTSARQMPGSNDRVAAVVPFACEQQHRARIASLQVLDRRLRYGVSCPLHQLLTGRTGSDCAPIELANLLGCDCLHSSQSSEMGSQ